VGGGLEKKKELAIFSIAESDFCGRNNGLGQLGRR